MTQLDTEIEGWMEYLVKAGDTSLYDYVDCDSNIERSFVEALDHRSDVKLYFKLPRWFTVATPVGEYNPDWAIVMEDRDAFGDATAAQFLYLVRETKGENWRKSSRATEMQKMKCGAKHFSEGLGTNYRVVTDAAELPGGELP